LERAVMNNVHDAKTKTEVSAAEKGRNGDLS
jgi:hypothetical protein